MVKPLAILLVLAGACALFSEGPPENFCRNDTECFRAQGEICDLESNRCIPGDAIPIDASIDAPADAADIDAR
jgi:hypothetical protein